MLLAPLGTVSKKNVKVDRSTESTKISALTAERGVLPRPTDHAIDHAHGSRQLSQLRRGHWTSSSSKPVFYLVRCAEVRWIGEPVGLWTGLHSSSHRGCKAPVWKTVGCGTVWRACQVKAWSCAVRQHAAAMRLVLKRTCLKIG